MISAYFHQGSVVLQNTETSDRIEVAKMTLPTEYTAKKGYEEYKKIGDALVWLVNGYIYGPGLSFEAWFAVKQAYKPFIERSLKFEHIESFMAGPKEDMWE